MTDTDTSTDNSDKITIHQYEVEAAKKYLERRELADKIDPVRFAYTAKKNNMPYKDVLSIVYSITEEDEQTENRESGE